MHRENDMQSDISKKDCLQRSLSRDEVHEGAREIRKGQHIFREAVCVVCYLDKLVFSDLLASNGTETEIKPLSCPECCEHPALQSANAYISKQN